MDTETEKTEKSLASNDPKEEDYSWTKENSALIKQYIRFPFIEWNRIIIESGLDTTYYDEKKSYHDFSYIILKEDVFKGQEFYSENNEKKTDIFQAFLAEKKINYNKFLFNAIKPDFIIPNISKVDFVKIFNFRDFMFKYDNNYNSLENIEIINIIGELKLNPDNIKNDQKNRYIVLCEYLNLLYKKNEYFMVLYISDLSYKKLWNKNFFKEKPIILGYIPKLYKSDYLKVYEELLNNIENNKISNLFNEQKKVIETHSQENENQEKKELKNQKTNSDDTINKEKQGRNFNIMNQKEILIELRKKEDSIRKKKRILEDDKKNFENDKIKFENDKKKIIEENEIKIKNEIKKYEKIFKEIERDKEDLLLNKKREIEDEEMELHELSDLLDKKKK